jgi:hypothetical protein
MTPEVSRVLDVESGAPGTRPVEFAEIIFAPRIVAITVQIRCQADRCFMAGGVHVSMGELLFDIRKHKG